MTKADETTETDFWAKDEEYERDITNWLVVAYDENADFAGYISGKDGTWTPDISNEDSRTTVEMKLPFGTYHFYEQLRPKAYGIARSGREQIRDSLDPHDRQGASGDNQ